MRGGQHPAMDPAYGGKPYVVEYYYGLYRVKNSGGWYVAQSQSETKCMTYAKSLNKGAKPKPGIPHL